MSEWICRCGHARKYHIGGNKLVGVARTGVMCRQCFDEDITMHCKPKDGITEGDWYAELDRPFTLEELT